MTRHIPLQTYVPVHVASWIREAAAALDLTVSVILRDIIMAAYRAQDDDSSSCQDTDKPERQSVFISIALDALLAAHPDKNLRARVYDDYARRIDDLGLLQSSGGETIHEA